MDSVLHSFDVARQLIEATDMSDPPKTLYAIKQLAREASIGETSHKTNNTINNIKSFFVSVIGKMIQATQYTCRSLY